MAWGDPNPIYDFFRFGDNDLKDRYNKAVKDGNTVLAASLKQELDADTTHQQQQLMEIAATAGASSGGTAVSHGQAMPYGDTAMFNPKAMPQRYLPGTKPREEEDLIPPGLFSPYRMYR